MVFYPRNLLKLALVAWALLLVYAFCVEGHTDHLQVDSKPERMLHLGYVSFGNGPAAGHGCNGVECESKRAAGNLPPSPMANTAHGYRYGAGSGYGPGSGGGNGYIPRGGGPSRGGGYGSRSGRSPPPPLYTGSGFGAPPGYGNGDIATKPPSVCPGFEVSQAPSSYSSRTAAAPASHPPSTA